ncbi:ionotropic receptor 75a-like [Epargyreus clarus]|uniref:ionotropic receptor 75a-like n=1 Tax=Epargyreus clarus TaxID=520877 RepID=UPI003C2DA0CE
MYLLIPCLLLSPVLSLRGDDARVSLDYFEYKDVKHLVYLDCSTSADKKHFVKRLMNNNIRISVKNINNLHNDLKTALIHQNAVVGVLLNEECENVEFVLEEASRANLFDSLHMWLLMDSTNDGNSTELRLDGVFQRLNLSIDTDLVLASFRGNYYTLMDVFNYGKIQGNNLEKNFFGTWSRENGLSVSLSRFKYYDRWDFHNLTLRAISVILDRPKVFHPEMLSELPYTPGVAAMTKITTRLLNILKEIHNFRFNYTIAGRWIGSPIRNSTLAVTNSLYWREQDISSTCARIFPQWLDWVDIFHPPSTRLETKFYYSIPSEGVGDYENRFLTPLSGGVWWCTIAFGVICVVALGFAGAVESRPQAGHFAVFSVLAAIAQQAYEDGVQLVNEAFSSQSRRLLLLIIGTTSMLLYNYYTSSVVSWLLNAAAPTLANLDALINSDLELVFEDIGYTRGWLDNPGFFYYSGFKNPKEDELRDKKVKFAKRSTKLLLPVEEGIELVRSGGYAYHTEPYTAYQAISRTFDDEDLCNLGSLQMMNPAPVYIMAQKNSPYRKFFIWSLMRLQERGHISASRARVGGYIPSCSGSTPRALALGQAAPAFALLAAAILLSLMILALEILSKR